MAGPLVDTKLHAPGPRANAVVRPRLAARIRRGTQSKLTLVSAPAGFGKTYLLAEHVSAAGADRHVVWLSLDASDNETTTFWHHFVASLRTVEAGVGALVPRVADERRNPGEAALATLVNELGATSKTIDIVLDDYHVIETAEIHADLTYLLERLPPNVHLLIGTRADPPLPLARLRARGELVEIRAADLRFTPEEARAYLNGAMGLELAPGDVATLAEQTEGWIAALQLAALSIEGHADVAGFIADFAGNDRYIFDYLLEEVLQRQPEDVRHFLRRTCFLDRLSGPLCDAVTGETGSGAMLNRLERSNLFVAPLDSRRHWFRYHHLFADVLQTLFAAELSDELPVLHRRASDWFANHEAPADAINHALAANDVERAAELIERAIPTMRQSRQEATLRAWLEALPGDVVRARPVLGVGLVGVLMSIGVFDGIEGRLADAERAIAAVNAGDPAATVVDREQLPALPGAIELYRSALAQVRGDIPAVITHARRSIDLAPENAHLVRGGAYGLLGIAYWTQGELESAAQAWTDCRQGLGKAGHVADIFGASIALADINMTLGRLRAAARVHEDALQLSSAQRGYALRGTADAHVGLGELHRLSGDLELAGQHLVRSQELGEVAGLPQFPYRWRVAMAHLREVAGDPEGALDLLDEAERVYVPDFFPRVRPIAARKARILIRQGRLAEAAHWQAEAGVAVGDDLTYLREFEHITLARLLLARGDGARDAAIGLLGRLFEAAEAGGRLASITEIAVLEALAHRAGGDVDAALVPLERALTLAAPEGFIQVFLDEGEPMAMLLKVAARRGSSHARTLVTAFAETPGANGAARPHPELVEALSDRESDVLRLLRSDLDGPDIARALSVSLNTMRTHTKNIYEKLGVNNRRAAVRRAEELDLLRR